MGHAIHSHFPPPPAQHGISRCVPCPQTQLSILSSFIPWDKMGWSVSMHKSPISIPSLCAMMQDGIFPPNPVVRPVLMHCRNWMERSAVSHALPPIPIFHPVLIQHEVGWDSIVSSKGHLFVSHSLSFNPQMICLSVYSMKRTKLIQNTCKRSSQSPMQENKYVSVFTKWLCLCS